MRIRWTQAAARDLNGICDYTNEHVGPEAARKLALRVYEAVGYWSGFRKWVGSAARPVHGKSFFPDYHSSLYIVFGKMLLMSRAFCMGHSSGLSEIEYSTSHRIDSFSTFPFRKTSAIIVCAPQPAQFSKQN